jgi:hypothetical protein
MGFSQQIYRQRMKRKEPMVIKGTCRMKKEPYARHELDIKKGDEFSFEYLGATCGAQRRVSINRQQG